MTVTFSSDALSLEHFQERWEPVFRAKMRPRAESQAADRGPISRARRRRGRRRKRKSPPQRAGSSAARGVGGTGAAGAPGWGDRGLEHFQEKACPGLDPGWEPVFRFENATTQKDWSAFSFHQN